MSSDDRTTFTLALSMVLLLCASLFLPLMFMIHQVYFDTGYIQTKEFNERWGSLYSEVKATRKANLMHQLVFVLRRLFYVLPSVYLINNPGLQVIILNLMSLPVSIYQLNYHPLKSPRLNVVEQANNFLLVVSIFLFMCFSDWVSDQQAKFEIGWCLIAVMVIVLLINLMYVLSLAFNYLSVRFRYYLVRLQWFWVSRVKTTDTYWTIHDWLTKMAIKLGLKKERKTRMQLFAEQ